MTDPTPVSAPTNAAHLRDALRDAFTLGWQIVELQCRLQIQVPATSADRGLRLPGIWHSCFNRIASITNEAFPEGSTANTLYAPPSPSTVPYLYPSHAVADASSQVTSTGAAATAAAPAPVTEAVDYADIGVAIMQREDAAKQKKTILADFQLYEATRRAINCLTLLSTNEDDSLIPNVIKDYSADLLTRMRPHLPQAAQPEEERARAVVTSQAVKFLQAWHGYIRQNYYTGGQVPDNNLELLAYEAGHAMSALSWELLLKTLQLESAGSDQASKTIEDAWNATFTDQAIIHLQHQISALSAAMDDAYYHEHPDKKMSDETAASAIPNPDLPSQSIQAVKSSLDYWIAAVKWMSANEKRFHSTDEQAWRQALRLALTEQTNVWQMLMSGQESLRGYNVETAAHKIIEDITDEIGNGLRQGFQAAIRQTEQVLQETRKEASAAIGNVFQSGRSACWILLGLGLFIALAGALVLIPNVASQLGKSIGFTGILSGIGSFLFGGYKWLGLSTFKEEATQKMEQSANPAVNAEGTNILRRVEGAVQEAESAILSAFQRGYDQMRIELDSLNRSIAITYPLVEFFGKELELDSNVDFLTDIFWSGTKREQEVKRVIRAAFGGLSLMVDPKSASSTK